MEIDRTFIAPSPRSSAALVTARTLNEHALRELLDGRCLALRIPRFCDPQLAERIAAWLTLHGRIEPYDHEVKVESRTKFEYYGVDRIGLPFNKTLGAHSAEYLARYHEEALPAIRRVREACSPHLSPIDRLRLELDEVWPLGCNVARFIGRKMFVGIVRLMDAANSAASEEAPHHDGIPPSICAFERQFGANIYMRVPREGGELLVWDALGPVAPTQLGAPSLSVKPDAGDLIVFHAQRMHAIRKFKEGSRISIHSFLGFTQGEALQLWN